MGLESAAILAGTTQLLGAAGDIFALRGRAELERSILDINRSIAERAAVDALARGDLEAAALRRRAKAVIGIQQARAAASGVDPLKGSVAAVQEETAIISAFERMMIRVSAAREAYGFRTTALEEALRAKLLKIEKRAGIGQVLSSTTEGLGHTAAAFARLNMASAQQPPMTEGARQILSTYPFF